MQNRKWQEIVPQLAALHRSGQLVPFIGLGMSRPRATDWPIFVQRLYDEVGLPKIEIAPAGSPQAEVQLLRLADDAMRTLRSLSHPKRRAALKKALFESRRGTLPPQASTLAEFRWPLVITTNYEDVFWHAAKEKKWNKEPFLVLARSLRDCHQVLRCLDWPSRPILWAIQGFLGGPFAKIEDVVPDASQRTSLLNQLVIGHRQYQEAAHLNPHFRRAFAEVFRRRALMFLGSGIAETYLANLFAEVLITQGQRAGSHYALLPEWEVNDEKLRFLADRLGVLAYTYKCHAEVEELLNRLLSNTKHFMPPRYKTRRERPCPDPVVEVSQVVYRIQQPNGAVVELVLDHRSIASEVRRKGCILAVSVGRSMVGKHQLLTHGSMSKDLLEALHLDLERFSGKALSGHLFPHKDCPEVVAVAARSLPKKTSSNLTRGTFFPDNRSLDAISKATRALLRYAAKEDGVEAVRVGLLSAGPGAPWHPIFACVIMLAAIRDAARTLARNLRVELTLVDTRVWTRILSGSLPVHEILSAARLPVLVELDAGDGELADSLVHMAEPRSTLKELLRALRLKEKDWRWSVTPVQASSAEVEMSAEKIALVPFSTISLRPKE